MHQARLEKLAVSAFRNIKSDSIEFSKNLTLFVGQNAQGKTNALEACYLALGKVSFRARRIHELIQFGQSSSLLSATIQLDGLCRNIDIRLTIKSRKIHLDGKQVSKSHPFPDLIKAVLLIPDDLNLIRGSPQLRRQFIDTLIGHAYPQHLTTLADYRRIVSQKNRSLASGFAKEDMIDIWNQNLADQGARLMKARIRCIARLKEHLNFAFREVFGTDDRAEMNYFSPLKDYENDDISALRNALLNSLEKQRGMEMAKRRSIVGPHFDDIHLMLNGRGASEYCSQGQAKVFALALKVLEVFWITKQCNSIPIFLLDDVFSELDEQRRSQLIRFVSDSGCQAIVTTTDEHLLAQWLTRDARCYQVKDGHFSLDFA